MDARPRRYLPGLPEPGRCLVMGVVNVTPDSFSDGGRWLEPAQAVAHARRLVREGADLVDVGGESTRPGATRPSEREELARVLPVVRELAGAGIVVSVDTMRAAVAEAALAAGAALVNDVSGGQADPDMFAAVARARAPYVLMHWRGHADRMEERTDYADVVSDVVAELRTQRDRALAAGVEPEQLAVDPGIGFAKTGEQNWAVLAGLERLHTLGHPVLVATSRKRFLGTLLADDNGPRPTGDRDCATAATSALAAAAGAWCVRVHAVRPSADAVRVAARWAGEGP